MTIKKSFTLIELLISISIFSLIIIAVYFTFANGLIVWKRGNIDRSQDRKIRLISEKIAQELRNCFDYEFTKDITFQAGKDYISFPAIIKTKKENTEQLEVGRVVYFFNQDENALYRQQKTYPEVYQEVSGLGEPDLFDREFSQRLALGIKEINFSYCYLNNVTTSYDWTDSWGQLPGQETIPKAVKIKLVYKNNLKQEATFERIVFIPIGTGEEKIEQ